MGSVTVLSHVQVTPLLQARKEGRDSAAVSLDLGLTQSEAALTPEGVVFADGQRLPWESLERIRKNDVACFLVQDNAAEKIQFFSPAFHRFYSLRPTERAPTMLVAGFPMHRIKGIDPAEDTRRKIRAVAPVTGHVLDTTTGLGYTAIESAKTADHVTTIELDPTALEVARRNPWSQALFDNPKIEQRLGSAFDLVPALPDEAFSRILHDPPTLRLAGELYSGAFYQQLFRVLRRGGLLFHYVGDFDSQAGRVVAKGVVRRLQDAGFAPVTRRPEAFGIVAAKFAGAKSWNR